MSSSPSSKRSLKPLPVSPTSQQPAQPPQPSQPASLQPAPELPPLQPAAPIAPAESLSASQPPQASPTNRKRKSVSLNNVLEQPIASASTDPPPPNSAPPPANVDPASSEPKPKKSRTNTPWTPAEELRLKHMRDAGNSWSEIAKTFPQRTEGSVKKHWYKDMHYAEFAEDESTALLSAIKEYESNKWKVIGQKVGKPAKACEQYAKEHFGGKY